MKTLSGARLVPWLIAVIACVSGVAEGQATTKPAIGDAQFDEALAAAEKQESGPSFTGPLQSVAPRFREVPVSTEPGKAACHKLTLNTRGKKIDAVRFRVPEGEPRDMVWAFLPTKTLVGWYILPTAGEMQGFAKFWRPSARGTLGKKAPADVDRVILQSLAAKHLKPGQEYLLWFRFEDDKPTPPLHLAIALLPAAADLEDQEDAAVVKGLGLTREGDDLAAVDLDAGATTTAPAAASR